ncbi:hypothetical protein BS78_05G238600 [Paspalum vaginatum]|nr:hypothetical protein BS78_05G238600 [Paspalum vaginatum]
MGPTFNPFLPFFPNLDSGHNGGRSPAAPPPDRCSTTSQISLPSTEPHLPAAASGAGTPPASPPLGAPQPGSALLQATAQGLARGTGAPVSRSPGLRPASPPCPPLRGRPPPRPVPRAAPPPCADGDGRRRQDGREAKGMAATAPRRLLRPLFLLPRALEMDGRGGASGAREAGQLDPFPLRQLARGRRGSGRRRRGGGGLPALGRERNERGEEEDRDQQA